MVGFNGNCTRSIRWNVIVSSSRLRASVVVSARNTDRNFTLIETVYLPGRVPWKHLTDRLRYPFLQIPRKFERNRIKIYRISNGYGNPVTLVEAGRNSAISQYEQFHLEGGMYGEWREGLGNISKVE